ncbi:Phosphate regulon transcriptional regulatory protein PhoB (SphR) [Caballeronia glathei]|jgi:CheY-like chemotaxis protein|uniref:Response regulator receiver protein n=1 Tax=Caballeronia glathei TaxID=60547 RepID=A0A069PLF3_9BURK|nr:MULTISPECIES: response regulator [Burkholderiaceae]KDR41237.1 response regulator receiver protein [Caballeronia glathei]TCK38247.1 response regulator receiver domain-containing protein [Paraburkholderia sp. BL8N3]CDY76033.1 Phosphate regulon transcriptional regulatory protein PhoB (SphR) [Caballeronia glathei]
MKKILVVDDEFDILTTWRLVLEMEGYEVVTASNGALAIDAARQNRPDLIVTDWMMPRMDGVALVRELAQDEALADVPVVLTSAAAKAPALTHRVAEFHRKPLSIDDLIAIVTRLIGPPA